MSSESHKQPSRKDQRLDRRERLAQELRANLLKRKTLARARRAQNRGPDQRTKEAAS